MDPLSVTASIAGVVSLTEIVIRRLFQYVQSVREAKQEISALLRETSNLGGVLRSLEMLARQFETAQLQTEFQTHHINACCSTLNRLEQLLGNHNPSKTQNALKSLKLKLHWPLSKSQAEEFLEELERHKSTLSLALEADGFSALLRAFSRQDMSVRNGIKDLQDGLQHLHSRYDMAERFVMSQHHQKILGFFGLVDPRKNQRSNLGLLHPGTGLWFTEGDDFKLWHREKNAKLWINGIPGAGKTILIARIIHTLQEPSVEDNAIAYFYCDYKDAATHDPANVLGSLAEQFARQDEMAFSKLERFYDRYNINGRPSTIPTLEELRDLVSNLTKGFDNALVIVDGLDECSGDRSVVIGLLTSLMDIPGTSIKCMFASRDEYDIRIALEDYVEVSIAAKGTDLKLYVLAEIEKRIKLGRLSIRRPTLKEEIMTKLIEKAAGMFRWVACQIDYICELSSDKERREALDSLPPTLPKTYERILAVVSKSGVKSQDLVRRTLQWLAYAMQPVTVAALTEALSVSTTTRELDEDSLVDESAIVRLCSSLIRRSANQDKFELAHFTVKEYLLSISEDDAEFSAYRLEPTQAHPELAVTCLRYLSLDNFSKNHPKNLQELSDLEQEYPFLDYASYSWVDHARPYFEKDSIRDSIHELFRPAKSHNFIVWALKISMRLVRSHYSVDEQEDHFDRAIVLISESSVLHWSCLFAIPEATEWLLKVEGLRTDKETALSHPIHFAIGNFELLRRYFGIVVEFDSMNTLLSDRQKIVSTLIEMHVDLEFSANMSGSPIQVACWRDYRSHDNEFPLTKLLLEAGVAFNQNVCAMITPEGMESLYSPFNSRIKYLFDIVSNNSFHVSDREWFVEKALYFHASCALTELRTIKVSANAEESAHYKELLSHAILAGQVGEVTKIVSETGNVPDVDIHGHSALFYSIEQDFLDIVEVLLNYGVNLQQRDKDGQTPLHLAAVTGSTRMLTLFAQHNLDIDAINCKGETPMMNAAVSGNSRALETLLDLARGKNIVLRRAALDGRTVLHYAIQGGSWEVIERVLGHFGNEDVYEMTPEGSSCLDLSIEARSKQAVQLFLEFGLDATTQRNGTTALHIAVTNLTRHDGIWVVQSLIEKRAGVNALRDDGNTPLHLLAGSRPLGAEQALCCAFLLEKGAVVSMQNNAGDTPLHLLCSDWEGLSQIIIIKSLLGHGAAVNVRNKAGYTCLEILFQIWAEPESDEFLVQDVRDAFMEAIHRSQFSDVLELRHQENHLWRLALFTQDQQLVDSILSLLQSAESKATDGMRFLMITEACLQGCNSAAFLRLVEDSQEALHVYGRGEKSPLHLASQAGHDNLIRILLDLSIDIDSRAYKTRMTPLMSAAQGGKITVVNILLEKGASQDAVDSNGWTALHHACYNGQLEVIRVLDHSCLDRMRQAATLQSRDLQMQDVTCLHLAVNQGHVDVASFLLRNKILGHVNSKTKGNVTPLHFASGLGNLDMVFLILERGADCTIIDDKYGWTALHLSCYNGHEQIARLLLERGADPYQLTRDGISAEMLAFGKQHMDIVRLFRNYALENSNLENKNESHGGRLGALSTGPRPYSNSLRQAIERGDLNFCRRLLDQGADPSGISDKCKNCTPLLVALHHQHTGIAQLLLERGASASGSACSGCSGFHQGYSPLHYAASYGHIDVLSLILQREPECYTALPVTPIHLAATAGHQACLEALLDHDYKTNHTGTRVLDTVINRYALNHPWRLLDFASIDTWNSCGTALHLGCLFNQRECVEILIAWGADIEVVSSEGETALLVAIRERRLPLVKKLLRAGANPYSRNFRGHNALHLAARANDFEIFDELCELELDLAKPDRYGQTALHHAASKADLDIALSLMNMGQRLGAVDTEGASAAHKGLSSKRALMRSLAIDFIGSFEHASIEDGTLLSQACSDRDLVSARKIVDRVKGLEKTELLDIGTGCNLPPLLDMAMVGSLEFVELLVDNGANVNLYWKDEGTALGYACEMGHLEIAKFLVERGASLSWEEGPGTIVTAVQKARYHRRIVEWLQDHEYGPRTANYADSQWSPPAVLGKGEQRACSQISIRRRPSFELEYALRRRSMDLIDLTNQELNFENQSDPEGLPEVLSTKAKRLSPERSMQDDTATAAELARNSTCSADTMTEGLCVQDPVKTDKEFDDAGFREGNLAVFNRAHKRHDIALPKRWFRRHALRPYVSRDGEGKPWTVW